VGAGGGRDLGRDFWYDFDRATQGNDPFILIFRRSGARRIQRTYMETRDGGSYPAAFLDSVQARREDWITMADVQTSTFGQFLGSNWNDFQLAFEDFGQGTLLDTRPGREGDPIHMMDGQTSDDVVGYHRWHASIRATQFLNIGDAEWWERLDTLVGFAWAVQSFAQPIQQDAPNQPLPQAELQKLRDAWLPMAPAMRDAQFDLPDGQDFGYHPSPMEPVVVAIV
jgi:hypothetical protein